MYTLGKRAQSLTSLASGLEIGALVFRTETALEEVLVNFFPIPVVNDVATRVITLAIGWDLVIVSVVL